MSHFQIDDNHTLVLDDVDDHLVAGRSIRLHTEGYAMVCGEYVHRLVLNAAPDELVDHRDCNRLNCSRSNLRTATKAQNGFNRGKARHNKSGFKGVYLCKQTGRYRSEIRHNRRCVKLGRFATAQQAALAYDEAARRLHGDFAKVNFTAPNDSGAIGPGCDA